MVRLKGIDKITEPDTEYAFLFQIGSIKSSPPVLSRAYAQEFLFQIGSIKRQYNVVSSKQAQKFLFQIGSIKRPRHWWDVGVHDLVSIPNWFD